MSLYSFHLLNIFCLVYVVALKYKKKNEFLLIASLVAAANVVYGVDGTKYIVPDSPPRNFVSASQQKDSEIDYSNQYKRAERANPLKRKIKRKRKTRKSRPSKRARRN